MKVIALIYGDETRWDSADEDERSAVYARYRAFGEAAGSKVVAAPSSLRRAPPRRFASVTADRS